MSLSYQEFPVPAATQSTIRCLWRLQDAAPAATPQTVYPDGCCEVILHLGSPMQWWHSHSGWETQAAAVFAAQQRSAIRLRASGPVDCIGLRLQPWAGAAIAGRALGGMIDRIVALDSLAPTTAATLSKHGVASNAPPDAVIELADRLPRCTPPDSVVQAVLRLQDSQGMQRIADLARDCQVSLRTLQVQFNQWVGCSAKEFARVIRLQATLRALEDEQQTLTEVALSQGFSDHAHASRELRHLTGEKFSALLRALRQDKDSDSAIALAAAFVRGRSLDLDPPKSRVN